MFYMFLYCCFLVAKPCPTLCDPMDCSPLGFSVHGISQARILEWVAISFSRRSSQPRSPAYTGGFFTVEPLGKPMFLYTLLFSGLSRFFFCSNLDIIGMGHIHHSSRSQANSGVCPGIHVSESQFFFFSFEVRLWHYYLSMTKLTFCVPVCEFWQIWQSCSPLYIHNIDYFHHSKNASHALLFVPLASDLHWCVVCSYSFIAFFLSIMSHDWNHAVGLFWDWFLSLTSAFFTNPQYCRY